VVAILLQFILLFSSLDIRGASENLKFINLKENLDMSKNRTLRKPALYKVGSH